MRAFLSLSVLAAIPALVSAMPADVVPRQTTQCSGSEGTLCKPQVNTTLSEAGNFEFSYRGLDGLSAGTVRLNVSLVNQQGKTVYDFGTVYPNAQGAAEFDQLLYIYCTPGLEVGPYNLTVVDGIVAGVKSTPSTKTSTYGPFNLELNQNC